MSRHTFYNDERPCLQQPFVNEMDDPEPHEDSQHDAHPATDGAEECEDEDQNGAKRELDDTGSVLRETFLVRASIYVLALHVKFLFSMV